MNEELQRERGMQHEQGGGIEDSIDVCLESASINQQSAAVNMGDYSPDTLNRIAATFAAEHAPCDVNAWSEEAGLGPDDERGISAEHYQQMANQGLKLEADSFSDYYEDRQMVGHRAHTYSAESAKADVLVVRCRHETAELHKERLGSGSKGRCIRYRDEWLTPTEFETRAGRGSSKDWKRSIKFCGQSLQKLIDDEMLTPHAISCTCSICSGDNQLTVENGPVRLFTPYKRKRKSSTGRSYVVDGNDMYMLQQGSQLNGSNGQQFSPGQSHEISSGSACLLELEEICNQLLIVGQQMKAKIAQARLQEGQMIDAAAAQLRIQFENESKTRYIQQTAEFKQLIKHLLTHEQEVLLDQLIPQPKRCAHCGGDAFQQCFACENVYYCNVDCQRNDWINHQALCPSAKGSDSYVNIDSQSDKTPVQIDCNNFLQKGQDQHEKHFRGSEN